MIECCAVGHATHSVCRSVGSCRLFWKVSGENLFREVFGEPYTRLQATWSLLRRLLRRLLRCPVGMETLAHRSFAFKDSLNWLEQKLEHTRRACNERDANSNSASTAERQGGRGIFARSSQNTLRTKESADDSL